MLLAHLLTLSFVHRRRRRGAEKVNKVRRIKGIRKKKNTGKEKDTKRENEIL